MLNSHPRAAGPRRRFAATLAATLGATLLLGACEGGRGAPDPASRDLSPAAQEPVAESPRAGTPPGAAGVMAPVYALANRCWQLGAGEQAITPQGGGYALATPEAEAALYLRPTGLGSYVLRDTQGGYLTLSGPLDALADHLHHQAVRAAVSLVHGARGAAAELRDEVRRHLLRGTGEEGAA